MKERSLKLASDAHRGQLRKSAIPCPMCSGYGESDRPDMPYCGGCEGKGTIFPQYITHPLAVAGIAKGIADLQNLFLENQELNFDVIESIALLHDTIEDTSVTYEDIRDSIDGYVADVVRILTHRKDVPYADYILNIVESGNLHAIIVKLADITHNMKDMDTAPISKHKKSLYKLARYILEEYLRKV